jgi:hypothetical protein
LWTPGGQEPDYESKEIPCPAYNSGHSVRKFSKIFFTFNISIFMINLMLPVCGKFSHINQNKPMKNMSGWTNPRQNIR